MWCLLIVLVMLSVNGYEDSHPNAKRKKNDYDKNNFLKRKKKTNKTLGMKMIFHVNLKGENCVLTKKKKTINK